MVSKQKSIFDKKTVVQSPKEKTKIEDEFVPLEESIFALNKKSKGVLHSEHLKAEINCVSIEDTIFCPKTSDKDDEDNKFIEHDDEVPFEESIFAKPKKSAPVVFRVPKENKIDYEALFNKYKELYMIEHILNVKRLNMIDSNVYNNCCVLLEKSRSTKVMNVESYDIVKRVIKSVCTCVEDVFYSYTNMNTALINLVFELNPGMDNTNLYNIIDRSYAEVIDEFRGK